MASDRPDTLIASTAVPYRNMTLEELSRHIGMDAREVEELANKGTLPGKRVGGEWRFNSMQLLDWLQREMHALDERHLRNLERAMAAERDQAIFSSLLAPEAIDLNLPARSRPSVLRELVGLAEKTGLVYDRAELIAKLDEREALCSTGLPGGFAFPHPRTPLPYATAEPLVCLARVPAGVPFGAPDGQLTQIFVLVCCHDERQHLHVLARLSLMFSSGLAAGLRAAESADEALQLVLATETAVLGRRG
jgi:PTS system nitrogen regulatory IIA component